jgi:hypothetical protein
MDAGKTRDNYPEDVACRERSRGRRKGVHMIRVAVEVHSGAARFRAAVWAESIERALSLVKDHYPGGEAKVVFPIEPEAFFVDGGVAACEVVHLEALEEAAR